MTTIRLLCQTVCLCVIALSLASCGQTRTYSSIEPGSQSARSSSSLEVPPDLVDTTSDSLVVNQPEEDAQTEEVLPKTENLDIKRNDAEGWLEVDAPADQVWRKLESYWGSLGVELVVSDPKTGTMVTDWVRPAQSEAQKAGFTSNIMDRLLGSIVDTPTSLDKYTIRLEKIGDGRTRINVAHQGLKKIQTQRASVATNAKYEWVETEEDPEKIKRALSSIVYGLDSGTS